MNYPVLSRKTEYTPKTSADMGPYELYIRFFGMVELSNRWGWVEENRSRLSLSWLLLKYLLVNRGREVTQEELLDTLWPGKPDIDSEGASRVRLRRLREALEPLHLGKKDGFILYGAGKYCLNPLYDIYSDEKDFHALLERLEVIPEDDPAGLDLCVAALELMRGTYMENTNDGPWLAEYRSYYAGKLAGLAMDTLRRSEALDSGAALELLCRRTAAIIPEDEAVHRAIVRLLMERRQEPTLLRHIAQLSRLGVRWLE